MEEVIVTMVFLGMVAARVTNLTLAQPVRDVWSPIADAVSYLTISGPREGSRGV